MKHGLQFSSLGIFTLSGSPRHSLNDVPCSLGLTPCYCVPEGHAEAAL